MATLEGVIEKCPLCGEKHVNPVIYKLLDDDLTIVKCPNKEGLIGFCLERYEREMRCKSA